MLDEALLRELARGPEKQWASWGTVEPDPSGDQKSVRFDDEDGNPLELGVLVDVKLHPSGVVVPCRVSNHCAGQGEGEWHPFGPGDEVLVVIPGGNERGGCCIIGRGNQRYDVMPRKVAGMDVTKNNVAWKRLRTAYALESATAITLSVATTGSTLSLDPTGNVWLRDGNGSALAMTPDVLQLGTGGADIEVGLQVDIAKKMLMLIAESSAFTMTDKESNFQSPGPLKLSTAGNGAAYHATTIEAAVNLHVSLLTILAAALTIIGPTPLTGTALAGILSPLVASFAPVIGAAAVLPLNPTNAGAINGGLSVPVVPGKPGLGALGLVI